MAAEGPELLSRAIVALFQLMVLAALLLFAVPANAQTPSVAPPAGFVRVAVSSNHLVSMPFVPFDSSINLVLGSQLTAGDAVLKWCPAAMTYEKSVRSEDPATDGKWLASSGTGLSGITIGLGDAFFVQRKGGGETPLLLCGSVPITAGERMLAVGLDTAGYPYPTVVPFAKSSLSTLPSVTVIDAAELRTPASLETARGFWVRNSSGAEAVWTEIPPWDTMLFSEGADAPRISGIQPLEGGKRVALTVARVSGAVDLFYMDIASATSRIDISGGWKLAVADLPAGAKPELAWEDAKSEGRPGPDEVYGRLYAVAQSGLRVEGVPLRDRLTASPGGSAAVSEGASAALLPGGGSKKAARSQAPAGSTKLEVGGGRPAVRAVYVDSKNGDDQFDGASHAVLDRAAKRGPKRTMNAALASAVGEEDVIYVLEGEYTETVRNSKARMIAVGRVILK